CLDGYPMTRAGRGGAALGITMVASFFAASFGIAVMVFASPVLVRFAFQFGPTEIFSIMLLGLLVGATMSRGSKLKGIAMTAVGLLIGVTGTDVNTGVARFTFGFTELSDKVELVALAMGLFGVAEFLRGVNRMTVVGGATNVRMRDMRPDARDLKRAAFPILRGTLIGSLFGALPGTGPTITTFIAYAFEKKLSKTPDRFGHGMIEGVAAPEAASHSKTQVDFIPTMSLGIPGDAVMALILGGLMIQGIQPGPQLISEHPDIFWGLIASFWIGNIMLVLLNVPMIGLWVKLLMIPYKYLYPSALFFICIGVYSTNNDMFQVAETVVFGVAGYLLLQLDFHPAPLLLGFVLGPRFEDNFRQAMTYSRGNAMDFLTHPISAFFLALCVLMIGTQIYVRLRAPKVLPAELALRLDSKVPVTSE
ncbi:MAG TPA: tripartite tricarboxylate transporter permease, partial [Pseudolabrys sp.]|nr:tripartite tricarboxylate transporter permease [Pseudolabrys sp.]